MVLREKDLTALRTCQGLPGAALASGFKLRRVPSEVVARMQDSLQNSAASSLNPGALITVVQRIASCIIRRWAIHEQRISKQVTPERDKERDRETEREREGRRTEAESIRATKPLSSPCVCGLNPFGSLATKKKKKKKGLLRQETKLGARKRICRRGKTGAQTFGETSQT
mmetsp:Transcript_3659/g.10415  ORF Transcript_3659/g.10415 Transcript_3659/m.10415 type:complete len:170 (+) Transcript_3659:584-1093(+)